MFQKIFGIHSFRQAPTSRIVRHFLFPNKRHHLAPLQAAFRHGPQQIGHQFVRDVHLLVLPPLVAVFPVFGGLLHHRIAIHRPQIAPGCIQSAEQRCRLGVHMLRPALRTRCELAGNVLQLSGRIIDAATVEHLFDTGLHLIRRQDAEGMQIADRQARRKRRAQLLGGIGQPGYDRNDRQAVFPPMKFPETFPVFFPNWLDFVRQQQYRPIPSLLRLQFSQTIEFRSPRPGFPDLRAAYPAQPAAPISPCVANSVS